MRVTVAVMLAVFSVAFVGTASGQDNPIPARQEVMKINGASAKAAFGMAKGETPFVAADAAEAMRLIKTNMAEYPGLFPVGSEAGGDTRASPKIWEDMDGFKAEAAKLAAAAEAAETAAADGLDAFKVALGPVGESCSSCHKAYRTPKN